MTRKRFVKQLMACGVSRNTANQEARAVVSGGFSYEERYLYAFCKCNGIGDVDALESSFKQLGQAVVDAVARFVEIIPSVCEAIIAAVPQVIANIERLKQETETDTE